MATPRKLAPGEVLFVEGDPSGAMYIVKKGKLSVFKGKSYHEVELAQIGPDEIVGEMAFFDRKPRSASVRAKVETEILEISFAALQKEFDSMPNWMQALVKSINEHLRQANIKLKELQNQKGISSY